MTSEWQNITLGDFVVLQRGHDLTADERKPGNVPVMGAAGQNGYHDTAIAKAPGIVIGRSGGSFGQVHFSETDYWPHNTGLYVTDFKGNDPYFAYYLLKLLNFDSYNSGSAQPSLNRNFIYPIKIRVPKPEEQTRIASVLSALDAKIELNNRIKAELEGMAKLLYDYWYVQYDFPISAAQAAALGKPHLTGKPYRSSGCPMTYNPQLKREIPVGWEVKSIESILGKDTANKKIPASEILKQGAVPVIDQSKDYICGYTNDESSLVVGKGTPKIIFGDHTRILKFINFDFARGADGTQMLVSNSPCMPPHLFYHALLKIDLSNYGYARHFKFLKQSNIVLPNPEIAKSYEEVVSVNFEMIRANIFQNQELAQLRDWLLPMLMNGQVSVK